MGTAGRLAVGKSDESGIGVAKLWELAPNGGLSLGVSEKSVGRVKSLMKALGPVAAPVGAKNAEGEGYTVLNHPSVYNATKEMGKEEMPVIIADINTKEKQYEYSLLLSLLKLDVSAISQGHIIDTLIREHRYTLGGLAELTGLSKPWLSRRQGLARNLSDEVKALVESRALPPRTAEEVAKLPIEKQLGFAEKVVMERMTKDKVAKLVGIYNAPETPGELKEDILENPGGVPLGKGPKPAKRRKRQDEGGQAASSVRFAISAARNAAKKLREMIRKGEGLPDERLLKEAGEAGRELSEASILALRKMAGADGD